MRKFTLAEVLVVLVTLAVLCCASACTYHPGEGGGGTSTETVTPQSVAARIRTVADAVVRIYPPAEHPTVAALAAAISGAAGAVETGDYQAAGRALLAAASGFPQFREYVLLATVALELLSPGPTSDAKASTWNTWTELAKKASGIAGEKMKKSGTGAKAPTSVGQEGEAKVGVRFENRTQ